MRSSRNFTSHVLATCKHTCHDSNMYTNIVHMLDEVNKVYCLGGLNNKIIDQHTKVHNFSSIYQSKKLPNIILNHQLDIKGQGLPKRCFYIQTLGHIRNYCLNKPNISRLNLLPINILYFLCHYI